MSDTPKPTPERRRELARLIPPLTERLETDAAEFHRLVRSFARRPQMLFLRELLRTGPARRSPENEVAWKGLRNLLLPILEKGEVQEAELPWFISWLSRITVTRMPRIMPAMPTDRPGASGDRPGFGGRPDSGPGGFRRDRFERPGFGGGRPGGPGSPGGSGGGGGRDRDLGRPPFRGGGPGGTGGGRGGPGGRDRDRDRDRDRGFGGGGGGAKMPPGPREVDTRWDALKKLNLNEDDEKKDKK